jgi:hypothetical protein
MCPLVFAVFLSKQVLISGKGLIEVFNEWVIWIFVFVADQLAHSPKRGFVYFGHISRAGPLHYNSAVSNCLEFRCIVHFEPILKRSTKEIDTNAFAP